MKKIFVILIVFINSYHLFSQSGEWQWVRTGGDVMNHNSCYLNALSTDTAGNIYAAGYMNSICFGNDTLISEMSRDNTFLVKFNKSGEQQWMKKIGTQGYVEVTAIDTDNEGDVYMSLYYYDTIQIDGFDFFYPDEMNTLVVKLDADNGQAVWAKNFRGSYYVSSIGLEVHPDYGIYTVSCFTADTLYIDGLEIPRNPDSSYDYFLALLDFDGNVVWTKTSEGLGNQVLLSVCTDKEGNCIVGGYADSLLVFEDDEYLFDYYNGFMAKFDHDGNYIWSNIFEGQDASITHMQCDASGNVYAYGDFDTYTLQMDSIEISGGSIYNDLFILKADTGGNAQWMHRIGGISENHQYDLFVEDDGTCYISGDSRLDWLYSGSLSFFTCFDSSGQTEYSLHSQFRKFEKDKNGNFITSGEFTSNKTVNDSVYTPVGYRDVFIGMRNSIDSLPDLQVGADITPINGIEETDGVIRIIAEGGTPPYYYIWGRYSYPDSVSFSTPGTRSMTLIDGLGFTTNASFYIGFADLDFDMVEDEYEAHTLDNYSIEANYHRNIRYYIWNEQDTGSTVSIDHFGTQSVVGVFKSGYRVYDTTSVVWSEEDGTEMNFANPGPEISLYPNPNDGLFSVGIKNFKANPVVEIFDCMGRLVYNKSIINPITELNLPQLKPGLYTVKLSMGNETYLTRFVRR